MEGASGSMIHGVGKRGNCCTVSHSGFPVGKHACDISQVVRVYASYTYSRWEVLGRRYPVCSSRCLSCSSRRVAPIRELRRYGEGGERAVCQCRRVVKSSSHARALHLADDCPRLTHMMGYPRPLRRARGPAGPDSSRCRRPLCRPDLPSARAGSCETARRRERRWKPEKVQQKVPLLLANRYFYFFCPAGVILQLVAS